MLRFLRAWAWLRWRERMNAIERSDRADRIQRLTRATEVVGPVMVALMLVPAALVASGLGLAAGYGMGLGAEWGAAAMHVLRVALGAALILTAVGPIALPSGRGLASLPRLLLLPVPRHALYAGELAGSLAEPWILMTGLAALMLVGGALASVDIVMAAVGVIAAVLLVLTFAGLGACFAALLHLLMGNRRRGEWILVAALTTFSLLSMVPMLMTSGGTREERRARESDVESRLAAQLETPAGGYLAMLPTELYVASVARAAGIVPGSPAPVLAGLAGVAGVALGAGWLVWQRAIDRSGISAGGGRSRGAAAMRTSSRRTATSGIGFTFLQHVTRTARGRALVLPSIAIGLVFAGLVAFRDGIDLGFTSVRDGFAVAVMGALLALLAPVQLWVNQFAIDRAGLTMLCLQPLSSAQILRGKMAGAAVLCGALAALPVVAGLLIGSPLPAAYWAVLALGAVAAFLVLAPAAALLSTFFPKHVDLSSIGARSNAHPVSALVGGLLTFGTMAPPIAAAIVGFRIMDSPSSAVGLAAAWLAIAAGLHLVLTKIAVRAFDRRREALVGVANGR